MEKLNKKFNHPVHLSNSKNRNLAFLKRKFLASIFLLALYLALPNITSATIYQPGETLEPDCAPGSINCGVVAPLTPDNNLSDVSDTSFARTNLGLGTLATQNGTFSGSSSGTNTGDQTTITGNAGTATALQTARTINGVNFDGTANITVASSGGTLTGTTLAANIINSSLTSVGTLANLTVTNPITGSVTGSSGSTSGNANTATALQTARTINGVAFDGTANITITSAADAGTLTGATLAANVLNSSLTSVGTLANLTVTNPIVGSVTGSSGSTSGNASTATALQTARNINGVSFNGTADITVAAAAGTLTGTTLVSNVVSSSLTSLGTIATGVWNGTTIAVGNGGTGTTNGSITGTGILTLKSANGGANTLTLDSGTTGQVNLGNGNNSKTINIGTGTAGNTINIGTDYTNADNIIIGSPQDAISLSSSTFSLVSTGLNVSGGALTGVSSVDTIAFAPTAITFAANGSLKSTTSSAITVDSGSIGTVNIGTSNNSKTVNIGNTTGTTQLNLNAGSNGIFLTGAAAANAGHVVLCINSGTNQLFYGFDTSTCDSSSARFKHNIADIGLGLDAVNSLRPVSYVYNSNNEEKLGFIAEEAAQVDERLIVRDKSGIIQGIHPDAFVPILTRAIQQVSEIVEDLSLKVTAVVSGYFDKIFAEEVHTEEICLKKSNGKEICINGDELSSILEDKNNNSNGNGVPNVSVDEGMSEDSNSVPSDTQPPVTEPAEIETEVSTPQPEEEAVTPPAPPSPETEALE